MKPAVIFRWVFLILTVSVMLAIFLFSNQPATVSDNTSSSFIEEIASVIIKDFDKLSVDERASLVSSMQKVVRKLAHFSIYAALGFFSSSFLYTYNIKKKHIAVAAFVFCVLYAGSDELHQSFIPGRSCQLTDVMIDSSGSLLGIAVVSLIVIIYIKLKNKKAIKQ